MNLAYFNPAAAVLVIPIVAATLLAVLPGMNAGRTIQSLLPAWQSQVANYAAADGYQVTRK